MKKKSIELEINGVLSKNDGTEFTLDDFIRLIESVNLSFGGGSQEYDGKGNKVDSDDEEFESGMELEMVELSDEEEEELGFNIAFKDGVPQWDNTDFRYIEVFEDYNGEEGGEK